jgi:hypothetical protein
LTLVAACALMALLNPVDRPLCPPVEAFAVSIRNARSIKEKEHEAE